MERFLVWSLVLLSACVGLCLVRIVVAPIDIKSGKDPKSAASAMGLYLAGLGNFVLYALGMPFWAMMIIGGALIVCGTMLWVLQSYAGSSVVSIALEEVSDLRRQAQAPSSPHRRTRTENGASPRSNTPTQAK